MKLGGGGIEEYGAFALVSV